MKRALIGGVVVVAALWMTTTASAADAVAAGDVVLAKNSVTQVTALEFEGELQRIPADMRGEFIASNKRVGDLLLQLLLRKTLALQAKADKLEQSPIEAARLRGEVDKFLAQLRLTSLEDAAAAEFDAKRDSFMARANEFYTVDRQRYRAPEEVSASHILFDTKKHTSDEAKALAEAARARVVAGANFNTVAKEVSEDPSAKENDGKLGYFTRQRMDPAFSKVAFGLKQVGDVSEPVQSSFGWHVIRLDGRKEPRVKSFDEVKDEILETMRKRYVEEKREAAVSAVRNDPATSIEDPQVKATVDRIAAMPVKPTPPQPRTPRQGKGEK